MVQREREEVTWDKKKIAVLIALCFIFGAGLFAAKKFLLPKSTNSNTKTLAVEGANIAITPQSSVSFPSTSDVQKKIQDIQKQVTHLDVNEIASSSPQIRQIMQQIQNLPNVPASIARNACENLCKKIK